MIKSDFHVHSEYSYDASNTLETIAKNALTQKLKFVGITDHVNYNDESFIRDVNNSSKGVINAQKTYPFLMFGVELTPIMKPLYDHLKNGGTRANFVPPLSSLPYEIELPLKKEELNALGVRYVIGASHYRVDKDCFDNDHKDFNANLKDWHRQQLWLANDSRITILGHPYYNGRGLWYNDFSVIPKSMHDELASVLYKNGKYVECNAHFFTTSLATEKFRFQYAEFLRLLFEKGIKITYGSDSHHDYQDDREKVIYYLEKVGFRSGDIVEKL